MKVCELDLAIFLLNSTFVGNVRCYKKYAMNVFTFVPFLADLVLLGQRVS